MSLMMMPMKLIVTSNTPVIAVDHTTTLFRINRFPILPKRKVQLRNVQKTWAGGRWQGQGVRTIILENLLVYLHPWPSFCSMTCPPLCSKLQMPLFHFLRIKKKKKKNRLRVETLHGQLVNGSPRILKPGLVTFVFFLCLEFKNIKEAQGASLHT